MDKTIAIIDDSRTIRSIIRKSVRAAGVDVQTIHEADNGHDGLTLIRKTYGQLSLIVMDLNMPKMDGLEVLKALRQEGLAGVPILVISSRADDAMKAACAEFGVKAFVNKPFTHETFRSALERVLLRPEGAGGPPPRAS
jgi:two-component system chemotaxis response regulator CheY